MMRVVIKPLCAAATVLAVGTGGAVPIIFAVVLGFGAGALSR
jgi:hypothetical protein